MVLGPSGLQRRFFRQKSDLNMQFRSRADKLVHYSGVEVLRWNPTVKFCLTSIWRRVDSLWRMMPMTDWRSVKSRGSCGVRSGAGFMDFNLPLITRLANLLLDPKYKFHVINRCGPSAMRIITPSPRSQFNSILLSHFF